MMTPIMEAVLKQLDREYLPKEQEGGTENDNGNDEIELNDGEQTAEIGSVEGDASNNLETEIEEKEMDVLAAPIHDRNTSKRGLVVRERLRLIF